MAHAPDKEQLPDQVGASPGVGSKPSQSLGSWIDNLLGDKKARARAARKAAERPISPPVYPHGFRQDPHVEAHC